MIIGRYEIENLIYAVGICSAVLVLKHLTSGICL